MSLTFCTCVNDLLARTFDQHLRNLEYEGFDQGYGVQEKFMGSEVQVRVA